MQSVVVRPHLLSTREQFVRYFNYGMTIADVAEQLYELDPVIRQHNLAALIDGETLPRDQWGERRLHHSDKTIEFAVVLEGGGGQGKQILGLVAMIALTVMSGGAAAGVLGAMNIAAEGTALLVAKAGIMMVGTLLIHAVFAPPKTPSNATPEVSPTYSFTGQSNQPRRFARLPRIYGKHRYVADVAALPYTVNVGDDVYLYCIYSFGYGPLKLEDFRIGQNPLSNYSDYDIEVHENFTDSSQLVKYKSDVWQDSLNLEVKQTTPITVTTQLDTESAVLDLNFPSGLVLIDDQGRQQYVTSDMDFTYRPLGSTGAFVPLPASASRGQTNFDLKFYLGQQFYPGILVDYGSGNGPEFISDGFPAGTSTFVGWAPQGFIPAPGSEIMVGSYRLIISHIDPRADSNMSYEGRVYVPYTTYTTTGLPGDLPLVGDQIYMYSGSSVGSGTVTNRVHFNEKKAQPFTTSISFVFPTPGQYEIQVTKVDADYPDNDTGHQWRRVITALRSMKNVPPLTPAVPISVVELVIKATGQLNGTIDQFSAIATSQLRQWDAVGNVWKVDVTRNPAWVYLDILQGTANTRPLPDNRIDLQALKDWAARCDQIDAPFVQPMGTCDIVVDKQYTVWDLMQNVAATGRAAPTIKDNKYSILQDSATRIPVQVFTNRNSSGLKSARSYQDEPHAMRVQWIDELNNYTEAETVVYNTGHDINNTTIFEDLQSFGMVRAEQVLRWGRYMFAQAKLRQERFSITVDIENIICTRGDLVLVAHDVMQVGGDPTRIVEVQGARLFVDAPPTRDVISDPTAYGVRVRRSDGYITPVLDLIAIGNDGEYDYVDVGGDLTGITADNLLVLGPKAEVVGEYVVDTITPGSDLSAVISLEELAPAVYNAEYTGLEQIVYTPQGGGMLAPPVANLTVAITVVYDGNTPMGTVRASWRPAQGMPYQPDDYRVWLITPTGNEVYQGATQNLYWELAPQDITTLNGYTFIFRVKPFYGFRGMGPPVETSLVVVYQPRKTPPLVDTFDVQDTANGGRRYLWAYNSGVTPEHVLGIHVRYLAGSVTGPTWAAGAEVVPSGTYALQNGDELKVPAGSGTFTFMARTIDDGGQLSDNMLTLVRTFTAANVVDLTPPPTPTNFTAVGGYGIVAFSTDVPSYSQGGGHAYTQVYAAIKATGGAEPAFTDAVPFTTFTSSQGTAGAADGTDYRFWAKWATNNHVLSVNPAGPVATQTAINVPATLAALTGQISDTQLNQELSKSVTGGNGNFVENPEFRTDLSGWAFSVTNNDPFYTLNRNLAGWFVGDGTAYILETKGFDATRQGLYAEATQPNFVPVIPGQRYQASAYTGAHRAEIQVDIAWYNASQTLIGYTTQTTDSVNHMEALGGNTLAGYKRIFIFGVAPANIAYARAVLRKRPSLVTDANNNSYGFFTRVMFTTARASQTAPDAYVSTGSSKAQEQAVVTNTTTINGLSAQYTVKIDTNGYVTGFGLASTPTTGAPNSTFAVRSDSFYIASPSGPGVAPSMPFIVRTTPTTINGQTVPVGVYMTSAYIQNGTIDSVKIGLAVITDANIANLNVNKVNAGQLSATYIDSRGLTIKDSAGNVIFSSGDTGLNFNTMSAPYLNYAPSIARTGWTYGSANGAGTGYRSSGLPYPHDGWFLMLNGGAGGYDLWVSPVQSYPGAAGSTLIVSFYAFANAAGTAQVNMDLTPGFGQVSWIVTQGLHRYEAVVTLTAQPLNAQFRLINYSPNIPVGIYDIQIEVNASGHATAWKPNFQDEVAAGNPLTPSNVGTFMAAATIGNAYIADLAVSNAKIADAAITTAKIGTLQVDTLRIADGAVTVPLSANIPGPVGLVVSGQTFLGETGWGTYPYGGNVTVTFTGGFTKGVGVRLVAFNTAGTSIQGTQIYDASVQGSTNPTIVPISQMFTLPAGTWKFQVFAQGYIDNLAVYQGPGTITALGVQK